MDRIVDSNGKQLSPCICSKAKYALQLKSTAPNNETHCAPKYWEKVIRTISKLHPNKLTETEITNAIEAYDSIFVAN